ncbi:MAG: hypothetical protein II601_01930 [Lachnospiraceae bacterium]|nr:hypothetical protein [Lachnospiraceae bacterium]MBR5339506.1 hypothetical protein [Lachnospiraceae bacterium]
MAEQEPITKNTPEEPLGNFKKPKRITVSRRETLLNNLKGGTVFGIIAQVLSIVALLIVLIGIYLSYRMKGRGGYSLGVLMILAFVAATASVILSVFGFRDHEKSRHYMERRSVIISAAVLIFLTVIFIRGLVLLNW